MIGASPLDGERLKHLHFEVWLGGPSDRIDPSIVMNAWETVTDPNAVVARNAGLSYRPVGAPGEAYPDWVRALKDKAGVYIIRDAETAEILYVGSSAGRRWCYSKSPAATASTRRRSRHKRPTFGPSANAWKR